MSDLRDGGPAFPVVSDIIGHASGITVRDWFAGQALAGYNANPSIEFTSEKAAEWAYKDADAMMKARDQ